MNDHVASAPETTDDVSTGIAEYSVTESGLADIRSRLANRVYDVSTTKGLGEAKKDRAELRGLRVDLEKMRVEIKAPALERCRQIDAEAKRLTASIVELEDPIDAQIKRREQELEEARQQREREEAERLRAINEKIAEIERAPLACLSASAEDLRAAIKSVNDFDLDVFDDVHRPTAEAARTASLHKLGEMLDARVAADAENARIEAERAELQRQRDEQAARDAEAAEARRVQQEQEDAARREQQEREDEERRVRQAEEDRQRAEQAEADRVERERVQAEQDARQAELDRQAAAQREADEKAEQQRREETERREAEERERQRQADEERAIERERAEAAAIDAATLRSAATEALTLLEHLAPNDLTTRKLAAALAREVVA